MPTAWIPASFSASPPAPVAAKKPSFSTVWPCGGSYRQHSMLLKTMSEERNSAATRRNGTTGSATFIKLTSPVSIILKDISCVSREKINHEGYIVIIVEVWHDGCIAAAYIMCREQP